MIKKSGQVDPVMAMAIFGLLALGGFATGTVLSVVGVFHGSTPLLYSGTALMIFSIPVLLLGVIVSITSNRS